MSGKVIFEAVKSGDVRFIRYLNYGGNYLAVAKAEGWKSKQWYNLVGPEMFGKANIGETVADELPVRPIFLEVRNRAEGAIARNIFLLKMSHNE